MENNMQEEKFAAVRHPVSTEYDLRLMPANAKIKEGAIYVNLIEGDDGSDYLAYAVIAPNGERVDDKIALNQLGLQPEQVKPFDIELFKQLPEIINKITNITLKRGHTFPAWKVNWESMQANINLRLLHGLLESEHTTLTRAKEKDLILLLGLSGAGKSTTVNYLKNCEMELYETETGENYLKPMDGNRTYAKMGCTVESETLAPNIIHLSDSHYFADCPGFEDNRGKEYKVCAKITTQSAIRWSNSVKAAVVLVNYASDIEGRAANFQRLVRELRQVLNDLNAVSPSMLFLINKAKPLLKPQHVITKIKQLKNLSEKILKNAESVENPDEKQREELAEARAQLEFFGLMLRHSDNIMIVNPLDKGESRELIMKRLATFAPIDRRLFNLPKHDNDHLQFNKLLELLFKSGATLLNQVKKLRKQIADDIAEHLHLEQALLGAQARLGEAQTNKKASILQLQLEDKQAKQEKERQEIKQLKNGMKAVDEEQRRLAAEIGLLNTEELVVHWSEEIAIPSDAWLIAASTAIGAVAAAAGVASGGVLSGAAGGVLIATLKKLAERRRFNYEDVPYPGEAEIWTNDRGWFIKETEDSKAGKFSATYYGNPAYTSKAKVTIKLLKKNIPANSRRIEAIKVEVEALRKKKGELNTAKMEHQDAWEELEREANAIKQTIEEQLSSLQNDAVDHSGASFPAEWEKLITELQAFVDELNHKIAELKRRSVELPHQLQLAEQEVEQRLSFMDFLSGVADFTNLPQGKKFNDLFREIHLSKLEAQPLQASSDSDDLPPPPSDSDDLPPPPPPYEVNEAKGDDGRPAAPGHASLFDHGASLNKPNVPPKQGSKQLPLRSAKAPAVSPV